MFLRFKRFKNKYRREHRSLACIIELFYNKIITEYIYIYRTNLGLGQGLLWDNFRQPRFRLASHRKSLPVSLPDVDLMVWVAKGQVEKTTLGKYSYN